MADITLAPRGAGPAVAVSACDVLFQLAGTWTAYAVLAEADQAPTGKVTLLFFGLELQGFVIRSGTAEGQASLLIAGGNGGLWAELPPRAYQQAPLRLPLQDLLTAAGEQLSPFSTTPVLQASLPAWVRRRGEAGRSLDHLADAAGAVWRVQPDGLVFVGLDTWTEAPDFDRTLVHSDPVAARDDLAPIVPGVLPGQTLGGRKVGTVHYQATADALTARVWYLDPAAPAGEGPLYSGLAGLVREVMRGVDWLALYPAKVLVQRADGTLDVVPDSGRLPPLVAVPVRVPVPGARLSVPAGARVLVGFEGGEQARPVAQLYEAGSVGNHPVARQTDGVGFLVLVISATMAGPVVTSVSWSATRPPPPAISPPVPGVPGTYYETLSITGGSDRLSIQ